MGTSLVAQMVKHLSTMWETQVQSLGWEDPLEKEMAIHSRTIAWKIPWTEEPGRLQSVGLQRVRHDWATSLQSHIWQKGIGGDRGFELCCCLEQFPCFCDSFSPPAKWTWQDLSPAFLRRQCLYSTSEALWYQGPDDLTSCTTIDQSSESFCSSSLNCLKE